MSTFRINQNNSNTKKLNIILSTIIFVLILNVSIQIWLMYTSLNYTLGNHKGVSWVAFIASLVLFLINAALMYYLPLGKKSLIKK